MSKDFIPAGESTGAVGKNGYQDFVPAPVPEMHIDLEPELELKPSKSASKRKEVQKKAKKDVAPVEALGEPEVAPLGDLEPEVEVK